MEKWRVERVKDLLKNYNNIDRQIERIEEELYYPHVETDLNADIKGTKTIPDNQMVYRITITDRDRRLVLLKKAKIAITDLLYECGTDTETIIRELYIKRFPQYTMQGLVDNYMIKCGKTKAFEYRNRFFEELDKALDI